MDAPPTGDTQLVLATQYEETRKDQFYAYVVDEPTFENAVDIALIDPSDETTREQASIKLQTELQQKKYSRKAWSGSLKSIPLLRANGLFTESEHMQKPGFLSTGLLDTNRVKYSTAPEFLEAFQDESVAISATFVDGSKVCIFTPAYLSAAVRKKAMKAKLSLASSTTGPTPVHIERQHSGETGQETQALEAENAAARGDTAKAKRKPKPPKAHTVVKKTLIAASMAAAPFAFVVSDGVNAPDRYIAINKEKLEPEEDAVITHVLGPAFEKYYQREVKKPWSEYWKTNAADKILE